MLGHHRIVFKAPQCYWDVQEELRSPRGSRHPRCVMTSLSYKDVSEESGVQRYQESSQKCYDAPEKKDVSELGGFTRGIRRLRGIRASQKY
jgi:hypothetical protein